MSIKQEPDTVKEDLANLDCDMKSDIKENSPRVKTEQFVQEENSALPNIINSQEQYIKDQVRTYDDFSGQEGCCEKADLLQEKEASAMAGYYHSNFTDTYCKSQFMSVQLKEEFTEHNTQVAIKYELNASTDTNSDIKIYKSGVKQDVHSCLPNSDDVLPNQQDQVKVYKCGTCSYSSNYLIDLYQHNISHGMDTVYFCDLCQSSYQYFLDLKCHLATHTARSTCENSSQPFHGKKGNFSECQTSEKDKQNSQNYYPQNNDHIIELFDNARNYTYKLECEVKQQNESNTGNVNSVVEDTSKCQSEKLRDTSIRKNTYPYACDLCKYSCTTASELKIHKRCHTNEKPYSCDLCSYTSTQAANLRTHKRFHTGEKPYSCDLCSYTCATTCKLKLHKRRHHTGEKP